MIGLKVEFELMLMASDGQHFIKEDIPRKGIIKDKVSISGKTIHLANVASSATTYYLILEIETKKFYVVHPRNLITLIE